MPRWLAHGRIFRMQTQAQGQTMVETLITLLFISISFVALFKFQTYLSYNNSLSSQKNEAVILAINTIENLRDFQVLNTQTGYTAWSSIISGSSTTAGGSATYTTTWT